MRRRTIIGAVGLLLIGLFAYIATTVRRSAPLLTIHRTSFPSCETRIYTITQNSLTVTKRNQTVQLGPPSPALLKALRNPAIPTLEPLYEDRRTQDGFELSFHFNLPGQARTVTVRNRYNPALYRILDEWNKLVPAEARFTDREHFFWMNKGLELSISDLRTNYNIPQDFRAKIIAELESRKVIFEE